MSEDKGIVVCPNPEAWVKLHARMVEAAKSIPGIPPPPVPLVLAGWAYSNDQQKQYTWRETVQWADRHGFRSLVDNLPDDAMYVVRSVSSYEIGPLGGPMHLPWSFEQKPRLSAAERNEAIGVLKSSWTKIAGAELGASTSPVRLTGTKSRRLLVLVTTSESPPWGFWTMRLDDEGSRRSFRVFRAAINAAIAPHSVDHVDFVSENGEF